jgi:hypothetical protein
MQTQPTQIVGDPPRGDLAGLFPQQRSKMLAKVVPWRRTATRPDDTEKWAKVIRAANIKVQLRSIRSCYFPCYQGIRGGDRL